MMLEIHNSVQPGGWSNIMHFFLFAHHTLNLNPRAVLTAILTAQVHVSMWQGNMYTRGNRAQDTNLVMSQRTCKSGLVMNLKKKYLSLCKECGVVHI